MTKQQDRSEQTSMRANRIGLGAVLMLALAVARHTSATDMPSTLLVTGSAEPNQQEGSIARPSNRAATGFVPRLGKRFDKSVGSFERLLCASSQDCSRLALLGALVKATTNLADGRNHNEQPLDEELQDTSLAASLMDLIVGRQEGAGWLPRRNTRASDVSVGELAGLGGDGNGDLPAAGTKRVTFTPRIGRR